jgi:hypothetical protein
VVATGRSTGGYLAYRSGIYSRNCVTDARGD